MDHFRNICRKYSNKSPENHFFLQVNESNKEYVSLLSNLAYIYTATGINESKQQEWETRGWEGCKAVQHLKEFSHWLLHERAGSGKQPRMTCRIGPKVAFNCSLSAGCPWLRLTLFF